MQYKLICSLFNEKDKLHFNNIYLPKPINESDEWVFVEEFTDLLIPYLFEDQNIDFADSFYREGPYEFEDKVFLTPNDIVFDCGANMGIFSAIASSKGCKVYAFEPMQYVINNYLKKTAKWNANIEIAPFALSDSVETLIFQLDSSNIGASKKSAGMGMKEQRVQTITIDSFVRKNNLERIDFIKADIEGAERKMLLGARESIRKFSPNISICTYHLPDDPVVLREILLDIQPKYKIIERYQKMYAYME